MYDILTIDNVILAGQQFVTSLNNPRTVQSLQQDYRFLVEKIHLAIGHLQVEIKLKSNKNWQNYMESWLRCVIAFTPSDAELVDLEEQLRELYVLLHAVQQGSLYSAYQHSLTAMNTLCSLAGYDPERFIRHFNSKSATQWSRFELALFLPTALDILSKPSSKKQKDLNRIKSSTYLCLSNFVLSCQEFSDSAELAWWLSMLGKNYLFWTYDLESNAYSSSELRTINSVVSQWLSTYQYQLQDNQRVHTALRQLIKEQSIVERRIKQKNQPLKPEIQHTFFNQRLFSPLPFAEHLNKSVRNTIR